MHDPAAHTSDSSQEAASVLPLKHRNRLPVHMPPPPSNIEVPWGRVEELSDFGAAEETASLRDRAVWEEVARPVWAEYDTRNKRRETKLKYTTEEGEALAFYRRAAGFQHMSEMLDDLQRFDRAEERSTLGLAPRNDAHVAARMKRIDGVPSNATMTRLLGRVPIDVERDVWKQIYEALRAEEVPLMSLEELLTLNIDSSNIEVVETCPIYQVEKDGNGKRIKDFVGPRRVVNARDVTCWDGGKLPEDYTGQRGFKATMLWSGRCAPLACTIASITTHDGGLGKPLFDDIGPYLKSRVAGQPMIAVVTGDSAFHDSGARRAIRAMGYIDNISLTSAYNVQEAAAENNRTIPFRDNPNWYSNGHREITCACGCARASRIWERSPSSRLVTARTQLVCPTHGTFTVTSGQYVESSSGWVKYDPLLRGADGRPQKFSADLRLGNGLTHNHWLSREYGKKRWAHNEGIHGALASRGQLLAGGNSFTSREEAEIALYQVMTALHIRGIEYRNRSSVSLADAA